MKEIEDLFKGRFKFELTTYNPQTYEHTVTFTDTYDDMIYKIETVTAISIETILENIIKEKRNKKIKNILL